MGLSYKNFFLADGTLLEIEIQKIDPKMGSKKGENREKGPFANFGNQSYHHQCAIPASFGGRGRRSATRQGPICTLGDYSHISSTTPSKVSKNQKLKKCKKGLFAVFEKKCKKSDP